MLWPVPNHLQPTLESVGALRNPSSCWRKEAAILLVAPPVLPLLHCVLLLGANGSSYAALGRVRVGGRYTYTVGVHMGGAHV